MATATHLETTKESADIERWGGGGEVAGEGGGQQGGQQQGGQGGHQHGGERAA